MSLAPTMEEVKKTHDELYDKVLKDHRALLKNTQELSAFMSSANRLVKDIQTLSAHVGSLDDYTWLSDAIVRWQLVFSSLLNIPKEIRISSPTMPLETEQPVRLMPEEEMEQWLSARAHHLSIVRKANTLLREADFIERIPSSPEEMNGDWRSANIDFADAVLKGRINFARQIGSRSYYRLERQWLREVKQLSAYRIWENRPGAPQQDTSEQDYYEACEQIRSMLVNRGIKASKVDFEDPRAYLETHYLTGGKIVQDDDRTKQLIDSKANRAWDAGGEIDVPANRSVARRYVTAFYENIIPAVTKDDPESVLCVLKAFQYAKGSEVRFLLVNCFEVALAIYFLDPDIIEDLWNKAEGKPYPTSWSISTVTVESWPKDYIVPIKFRDRFRLDRAAGEIVFEGVMTESQRAALSTHLTNPEHLRALNELFEQSRLLPREMTL